MAELPTLSNPRTEAHFDDWPSGRYRTECRFYVESNPKRGQRVCRVTKHPKTGRWCKPKKTTYAWRFLICDGDDGKTYLVSYNPPSHGYGESVAVWLHDCQHTVAYFYPEHEGFDQLVELFAVKGVAS